MDDTTMLVAQLIGPVYLVVGLGLMLSKDYYKKVYGSIMESGLAVMLSGFMSLIVGLLIVLNHNLWGSLAEVIVSLIGWGAMIKGTVILLKPDAFNGLVEYFKKDNMIMFAGLLATVIGIYFTVLGYFM